MRWAGVRPGGAKKRCASSGDEVARIAVRRAAGVAHLLSSMSNGHGGSEHGGREDDPVAARKPLGANVSRESKVQHGPRAGVCVSWSLRLTHVQRRWRTPDLWTVDSEQRTMTKRPLRRNGNRVPPRPSKVKVTTPFISTSYITLVSAFGLLPHFKSQLATGNASHLSNLHVYGISGERRLPGSQNQVLQ